MGPGIGPSRAPACSSDKDELGQARVGQGESHRAGGQGFRYA